MEKNTNNKTVKSLNALLLAFNRYKALNDIEICFCNAVMFSSKMLWTDLTEAHFI